MEQPGATNKTVRQYQGTCEFLQLHYCLTVKTDGSRENANIPL